ncbi:putative NTP pyrophosphohydrolase [Xanthomonas phage RiverRider]|uniref:NTP pyrophosphohydrolase n=1 Tax=Xanthomonas phage RiverRider TaxID=2108116 RepID=A0A2P1JUW0_9CAUD|nr:putative NTP pyrophosphohydrolase [Xanthomonas phage RiverRider]AVO23136.1 putative NTP pyrophosphohydrolase [Xanthomonas phage RiverRider]
MDNSNNLLATLNWFRIAKPSPTQRDIIVQTGVHFEEVTEHLDTVTGNDVETSLLVMEAKDALKRLADHMKSEPIRYSYQPEDHLELLDALCDQNVTGVGIAYMLGFEFNGAMTEVNGSNFSKFVNGEAIFTEQGKIAKGPDFFRPDLGPYL